MEGFNLDYFNNGVAAGGSHNYDDAQYNAQGQSLAPTTPLNNAPITTDYSNDNRNAMDYKQQARQAQLDTMPAYNTDNKIVMKDGYLIDKIPNSRKDQMTQAAMAYADAYFSSRGNVGAAALSAGDAVNQMNAISKRQDMIKQLEATGRYQSIDLEKWAHTGNTQDLLTNAGKWQNMGNGIETNTLTGESRQIPGYQQQEKLTQVHLGDRIAFVNQHGQEVNSLSTGVKPGTTVKGASGSTGGGIGLDDEEAGKVDSQHMQITDPDGTVWHVATNSRGTPVVDAKTGMATVYNDKGQTSSRVYNGTYTQQSGQVATEGLNSIKALRESGLLHDTGSSLYARGKRAYSDATGGNITADTQSHFDNINDQVHTFAVNKLIQEGVRPTEELVKAEMNRYGHLDINNSRERNLAILDKLEGAFNSGFHQAAGHATHTEMKATDYSSPGNVPPTGSAAATRAKSSRLSDEELLKQYGG